MKTKTFFRTLLFNGTVLAYILLFTYAATSKIIDFENFQVQLAQSPMLSAFSTLLSFAVPALEFLIIALLIIPRHQLAGMFLAFTVMVMFTAYIYIILNYSSFVPCSCGGVLEKMTWGQHLVFNLSFAAAGAAAIIIAPIREYPPLKHH